MAACAIRAAFDMAHFRTWQVEHVAGMLACAVFDFGSDDGRISCVSPWQSAHFAPRATPDLTAFACRLLSHAATESGWHEAQSTAFGAGSCGYALTSAWQFVQSSGP